MKRGIQVAVSVVLVGAIFFLVFRRVDLPAVWTSVRDLSWREDLTIVGIVLWNLVTYCWLWVAVAPGLSFPRAFVLTQSGTAATNVIPGGSAIGVALAYRMFGSWGFTRIRASLAVLVSGAWNTLVKLAMPILALALMALQGDVTPKRVVAGVVGLVLLVLAVVGFGLFFRRERVAFRAGELAGRIVRRIRPRKSTDYGPAMVRFRADAAVLLRARWLSITVAAVVSHVSLYLVLLVSLRHVGVPDVEAVLISALVAAGGPAVPVAAAVLLYRALTWLLPVPIGALAYLSWRRRRISG